MIQENCIQRRVLSPPRTSLSMFHQIAKQMDAALQGLNKAPDIKVKFSFIYLGFLVNMLIKMENVLQRPTVCYHDKVHFLQIPA